MLFRSSRLPPTDFLRSFPLRFLPRGAQDRAREEAETFPWTPASRRPRGRPRDNPSPQLAAEGPDAAPRGRFPCARFAESQVPGGKASLGQPGPARGGQRLDSRGLAPGTSMALPGGWARPQDPLAVTDPTGGDARPPAARSSPNSRATSGPGPSVASPAPPWAPALNSALGASRPFQVRSRGWQEALGITGPPARTSCALAGARMEGPWRLFLALFPPWPRATAINF